MEPRTPQNFSRVGWAAFRDLLSLLKAAVI
jgi:hypothetical protein